MKVPGPGEIPNQIGINKVALGKLIGSFPTSWLAMLHIPLSLLDIYVLYYTETKQRFQQAKISTFIQANAISVLKWLLI